MLSSIHPLGERARNNRWWVTVSAFTVGAVTAGSLVGAGLGLVGDALVGHLDSTTRLAATALLLLTAGGLDVAGVKPPGPTRQVNEHWIGHYRGWVYGAAFGAQLGAGVSTFVVTWAVYATLATEILTGSMTAGAFVGMIFGFGRSIAVLLAGSVDRPSRLTLFHRRMAELGPSFRRSSAWVIASFGLVALLGALL